MRIHILYIYVCVCVKEQLCLHLINVGTRISTYIYMYLCIIVYMYICKYIYVCMYIYIYTYVILPLGRECRSEVCPL